jgi:hypothetical protein
MTYTINLDDDFISAEKLQLTETKHAILEKLRAHFGEYSDRDGWTAAHRSQNKESPKPCRNQAR